ncbi:hypothetical protein KR059_011429 [Drosophila kikkawai]|nr:hypothetical protein KR059_011429 [Drosophila kikkawai]
MPKMSYSEEKKAPALFFWGGGLEKLQGGLKEEEYFTSLTQNLMFKMGTKKDDADYLPNWDVFQKTLETASLFSSSCMNKHKNALEEAFFLNETADNMKIIHDRAQGDQGIIKTINIMELKSDSTN